MKTAEEIADEYMAVMMDKELMAVRPSEEAIAMAQRDAAVSWLERLKVKVEESINNAPFAPPSEHDDAMELVVIWVDDLIREASE